MGEISEKDLILPALLAMRRNGGSITMSKLIDELRSSMSPKGKDLAILDGRQDDHFSQKVRNLVSHRTLVKKGFAKYVQGKDGSGLLALTAEGRKHSADGSVYGVLDVTDLENEHLLVSEGHLRLRTATKASRSQALRKLALKMHGSICTACGLDFHAKYKAVKRDCIELHHVVPISEGIRENTIKNLIPLCPNCHRVAHTTQPPLSISAIRRMLQTD